MSKQLVRNIVSIITIFGHLIVFIAALSLGIFSLLGGIDATQTLLMASPILAVTALAAFTHVLDNPEPASDQGKVSALYATLCIVFPIVLIAIIMVLFYLFYVQLDRFGPDQLKISLGAVETFFGAFIGAISRALFGVSTNR